MGEQQYCFPRTARLLTAGDYRKVFDQCQCKSSDRWLTVLAITNNIGQARLGMAVSRKADKSAVKRNRIKRVIRDVFRQQHHRLGNWDLVFIARPGIAVIDNSGLRQSLEKHWTRLIQTCADC